MKLHSRSDLTRFFCAVIATVLAFAPVAHAETLVVANKAEATVSLIDLEQGDVVGGLQIGHKDYLNLLPVQNLHPASHCP